jgi:prepilin-type processing-associated H-X9-DG protein
MNSQLSKGTNVLQQALFSSIQFPAQTVLFLECGVTGETLQVCTNQKPYNARPYSWAVRLSARHNRGSNLAFADGHVQWFLGLEVVDPSTGMGYPSPCEVRWTP